MNKELIIEAYNNLNNAFSNYMVGDMDTPRVYSHQWDSNDPNTIDELKYEARHLATKLLRFNKDPYAVIGWIKIIYNHAISNDDSFEVDGNEGDTYNSKKIIECLCLCYQLDEHRPEMIKIFVDEFLEDLGVKPPTSLIPMEYSSDYTTPSRVLYVGTHKGITFVVVSHHGQHPNGYVEVTGTKYDDKDYYNALDSELRKQFWKDRNRKGYELAQSKIRCHGGVNFSEGYCFGIYEPNLSDHTTRWFIGWDYGHRTDYRSYLDSGRKWTTEEVIEECKSVIDQIYSH